MCSFEARVIARRVRTQLSVSFQQHGFPLDLSDASVLGTIGYQMPGFPVTSVTSGSAYHVSFKAYVSCSTHPSSALVHDNVVSMMMMMDDDDDDDDG